MSVRILLPPLFKTMAPKVASIGKNTGTAYKTFSIFERLGSWIRTTSCFVLIQAKIKSSNIYMSKPMTRFRKESGSFTPNNGKRMFKSNTPHTKKAMPSPTMNKRFSQKDIFLVRKINEMRKPGNKIQVQKEISVEV